MSLQVTAAATAAATAGPAAAAAEQQQDGKASSPEADPLPETLQLKVQVLRSIDQVRPCHNMLFWRFSTCSWPVISTTAQGSWQTNT